MAKILGAFLLTFFLAPATPTAVQEIPTLDVAFCSFTLPAGLKEANASFYVSYSFSLDENGIPTNLKKIRNDYVEEAAISSCLATWRFSGIQKGAGLVAVFRWEHAKGWVDLSITGAGLSQRIRVIGDRCPYSPSERSPK